MHGGDRPARVADVLAHEEETRLGRVRLGAQPLELLRLCLAHLVRREEEQYGNGRLRHHREKLSLEAEDVVKGMRWARTQLGREAVEDLRVGLEREPVLRRHRVASLCGVHSVRKRPAQLGG